MKVILGDGTPQAYFQASIFEREASSIGAMWHGCGWSLGLIMFTDPNRDERSYRNWTWEQPKP